MSSASIKKLRTEAGLTQKKLAVLAGVSQAHIAKIEQGKVDPRLSTVNRILNVLTEGTAGKCRDVMTKGVLFAKPDDSVLKTSEVMVRHAISQLPVKEGNEIVGTITEESIIKNLGLDIAGRKVKNVMGPQLPQVPEDTDLSVVRLLLKRHQAVLVTLESKIVGIIARADILRTIG